MNELWHSRTRKCYTAVKINELQLCAPASVNLTRQGKDASHRRIWKSFEKVEKLDQMTTTSFIERHLKGLYNHKVKWMTDLMAGEQIPQGEGALRRSTYGSSRVLALFSS